MLVVEEQPKPKPAAHNSANAAMMSNRSVDPSNHLFCIAFTLCGKQRASIGDAQKDEAYHVSSLPGSSLVEIPARRPTRVSWIESYAIAALTSAARFGSPAGELELAGQEKQAAALPTGRRPTAARPRPPPPPGKRFHVVCDRSHTPDPSLECRPVAATRS